MTAVVVLGGAEAGAISTDSAVAHTMDTVAGVVAIRAVVGGITVITVFSGPASITRREAGAISSRTRGARTVDAGAGKAVRTVMGGEIAVAKSWNRETVRWVDGSCGALPLANSAVETKVDAILSSLSDDGIVLGHGQASARSGSRTTGEIDQARSSNDVDFITCVVLVAVE